VKTFILEFISVDAFNGKVSRTVMGVIEVENLKRAGEVLGLKDVKLPPNSPERHLLKSIVSKGEGVVCEFVTGDRATETLKALPLSPVPLEDAAKFPLCLREVSKFVPPQRPSELAGLDPFAVGC